MSNKTDLRLLLKAMRRMARALDIQSCQVNRRFGLTLPQLIVLDCVRDLGEVTTRDISREADLSPPTVVGILDKLEAKGLVERYRSPVDRRVVHTRLTAGGHAICERSPQAIGAGFEQRFSILPAPDRAAMIAAVQRLADLFDAVHDSNVRMTPGPTIASCGQITKPPLN